MFLEVKQVEPKLWGLYVNGSLLGTSKNRFDADHGRAILENAVARVLKGMDHPSEPDGTGFSSLSEQA
jgi:hypothetical protein